jgi:hypothetical protein
MAGDVYWSAYSLLAAALDTGFLSTDVSAGDTHALCCTLCCIWHKGASTLCFALLVLFEQQIPTPAAACAPQTRALLRALLRDPVHCL